jgi:hypothetical protein
MAIAGGSVATRVVSSFFMKTMFLLEQAQQGLSSQGFSKVGMRQKNKRFSK